MESRFIEAECEIVIGALLHDIGKPIQRLPENIRRKHSTLGAKWLEEMGLKKYKCYAQYHHAGDIDQTTDFTVHYVAIADNLSATERPERAGEEWESYQPLRNIFDIVQISEKLYNTSASKQTFWPLKPLTTTKDGYIAMDFPFVISDEKTGNMSALSPAQLLQNTEEGYREIKKLLEEYIKKWKPTNDPDKLLLILEKLLSFVPSETNIAGNTPPDISLFDHLKTTAMIAVCLRRYMYDTYGEEGIHKSYENLEEIFCKKREKAFLLLHGSISGIQNFVYTITSKGALKSLRARSFYLQVLQERLVWRILEELNLYRVNIHYIGGGNFYLILPNTQSTKNTLTRIIKEFNEFAHTQDLGINLITGWTEFDAESFKNMEEVFRNVVKIVNKRKLHPYSHEKLKEVLTPKKDIGETCKICGKKTDKLYKLDEAENEEVACSFCYSMYKLGGQLIRNKYLIESKKVHPNSYITIFDKQYEITENVEDHTKGFMLNYFEIPYEFFNPTIKLWPLSIALYVPFEGSDLDTLANRAIGIQKIGILRGDVDNLGKIFAKGISTNDKYRYVLSRISTLSRLMTLFFSHYLPAICARKLQRKDLTFSIVENQKPRNVVIVYSGGDDFFIIGSWNDVLETAIEINKAFKEYVGKNEQLSISMGYVIDHSKAPIYRLAKISKLAEDLAKGHEVNGREKNSIAVFPTSIVSTNIEKDLDCFFWDEVDEIVRYLKLFIPTSNTLKINAPFERAFIYKLFNVVNNAHNPFSHAIMAYIAARTQENSVARRVACTILDEKAYERETLRKALQIYDLLIRGGE